MMLQISDNCVNCGLMMIQLEHVTLYVESDHTVYTRNCIRLDAALISVWRSYRKSALCNYLIYRPKYRVHRPTDLLPLKAFSGDGTSVGLLYN